MVPAAIWHKTVLIQKTMTHVQIRQLNYVKVEKKLTENVQKNLLNLKLLCHTWHEFRKKQKQNNKCR